MTDAEYSKAWRLRNPGKHAASNRAYRQRHPEKVAEHNRKACSTCYIIDIDLSALDKHDEEVREERDKWWRERTSPERVLRLENERKPPLVDALEAVRARVSGSTKDKMGDCLKIIDDALAKVGK